MGIDVEGLLAEQVEYYRARATEYDRDLEREGLQALLATLDELPVAGDVLELACGTGQWTPRLAARARTVTAVDASAEMLEVARGRAPAPEVEFVQADVFAWRPTRRYDTVFFGFWLSHVPPTRMAGFWETVAAALAPGGRAIFVDEGPDRAATEEEVLHGHAAPAALRSVDDGRRYRIVKVYHDAEQLTGDLATLGWSARIRPVLEGYFVGVAEPAGSGARSRLTPNPGPARS